MKEKRFVLGTVLAAILVGLAALLLATPASWKTGWFLFHATLATTTLYSCLHIGSACLFLMSLSAYKTDLRRSYRATAVGIVVLALSTFQVAVIAAFDWWNTFWVNYGLVMLPFLAAAILVYGGVRGLARLVAAKTLLTRPWVALASVTLLSILVALSPHVASSTPDIASRITSGFIAWTMWMFVVSGLITLSVMRHTGAHYKTAMGWLAGGLFGSATVLLAADVHSMLVASSQDQASLLVDIVGVFAGVIYLAAGYVFSKTSKV